MLELESTDPIFACYVYVLRCADGTLYTGWTNDIEARLQCHNAGKGAKYTRTRLPVALLASWEFPSKPEAMRFEHRVKQLSRTAKLALIAQKEKPQRPN